MNNRMELRFSSWPVNEAFARMVISSFLVQVNPTINLISEVKTAVSEAVTNAVVHAYSAIIGEIILRAEISDSMLTIEVEDYGCGIEDVNQAMIPFFTSKPDGERVGIGFALMQSFMDKVEVVSSLGNGTLVRMQKCLDVCV